MARNRAAEGYGDTKGYLMPKTIKLFFKKDYINVSCAPQHTNKSFARTTASLGVELISSAWTSKALNSKCCAALIGRCRSTSSPLRII